MIISVNWLKKYTTIDESIADLATLIGARLVEIEEVVPLAEKYKGVVVARVVECRDVEESDHLHVTKIDDGGKVQGVERDENGHVQVVCGAPNVREGLLVAWLPPQSIVPETFGSGEPFVLGARKLRGYMSNGMLASARELDLYDEHDGILEIDKDVKPGVSFAEVYELDDTLLDIENKSLTHRPDTFGVVGFAREVAAIQGEAFTTPEFLANIEPSIKGDGSVATPHVVIENEALSERYQAVVLAGAKQDATSPIEMQTYLSRSGVRPINAIVDVTNYLMLLTGQPLHAFDYDKLVAVAGDDLTIRVRGAKKDETLELLDGRTITMSPEDIVIAAGDTAVALAGAMGGAATEIDATTKRIIIESATFNLYNLRATQMRHGVFSEAVTRFTKGQPAALTAPVLAEAVRLIGDLTGAQVVSSVAEAYPHPWHPITVQLSLQQVTDTLGAAISEATIVETLRHVECGAEVKDGALTVTVPYWRHDLHIPEDIIEEIGRLNGFDSIEPRLPRRDFTAVEPSDFDRLRTRVRDLFTRAGANEVLTYSFVHGDLMKKVGQMPDSAYRITNSISPDLQYYRQSIVPSLLAQVNSNVRAGYDHFALYEWNKFHTKREALTDEEVPKEVHSLGYVVTDTKGKGAAYYEAKRVLDFIADELHIPLTFEPLDPQSDYPVAQPFEPKRSARVWGGKDHVMLGVIGEFKRSVAKALKLPDYTAGFEISPRGLLRLSGPQMYVPSSKFPSVERDICIQVGQAVPYQQVIDVVQEALAGSAVNFEVSPVDIYQPDQGETKNITLRVRLTSLDKTLQGEEVATIMATIEQAVRDTLKATII